VLQFVRNLFCRWGKGCGGKGVRYPFIKQKTQAMSWVFVFLRNDLEEIYKLFCDNNKIEDLNLPTNGVLTDVIYEKTKNMLNSRKIKNFNIVLSLDGTKDIHNEIRGINCYDNVFNTYNKLIELKKQHKNLLIKVNNSLLNSSTILNKPPTNF